MRCPYLIKKDFMKYHCHHSYQGIHVAMALTLCRIKHYFFTCPSTKRNKLRVIKKFFMSRMP